MELPHLDAFLTHVLVERSGSRHTQKSYARDLKVFSAFLENHQFRVTHFSQPELKKFCDRSGLSPRSQARMISTLRSYFRYLHTQGTIKDIPKLEMVAHTRSLPEALSVEEVRNLIDAAEKDESDNPKRAARNRAVMILLYATGCRVSELCSLDLIDAQLDLRLLKITGKGSKERLVPLVTEAAEALQNFLAVRLDLAEPIEKSLIVNDRGHRPSRIDIFRWLKRWSKLAGFSKNVSPHKLRHACATHLLKAGVDLRTIQTLLGHASIATTEVYTRVETSDLDKITQVFHPLSEIHLQPPSSSDGSSNN